MGCPEETECPVRREEKATCGQSSHQGNLSIFSPAGGRGWGGEGCESPLNLSSKASANVT